MYIANSQTFYYTLKPFIPDSRKCGHLVKAQDPKSSFILV